MTGIEWLIEAFGCADTRLRDQAQLSELFEKIIGRMELRTIGKPVWHAFPESGGVTGVWLLQESHLAIHTFPEYRSACINIFCCVPRTPLDWESVLFSALGATDVSVRECRRAYQRLS